MHMSTDPVTSASSHQDDGRAVPPYSPTRDHPAFCDASGPIYRHRAVCNADLGTRPHSVGNVAISASPARAPSGRGNAA
jgi:hypothetical protein